MRQSQKDSQAIYGIYFASHFHNFYHEAPISKVCDYLSELNKLGQNTVSLWFDMHHFTGLDDPQALEMLDRMQQIFRYAHSIGMKACITHLANEYYSTAPRELLAQNSLGNGLYHHILEGFYNTEVCPSTEQGRELLLQSKRDFYGRITEHPDYIVFWPYDQGGCTCEKCYPWGANGFYDLAKEEAQIARQYFPDVKVILSTWYFERFTDGEWDAFFKQFDSDERWFDVLMVDMFAPLPERLHTLGMPIISFPEISMRGMEGAAPWGGFGANPYPMAIKKTFESISGFINGGFAYSEGIFEDINKAVVLALYQDPKRDVCGILNQYCAKYFSDEYAERITALILGLEQTLERRALSPEGEVMWSFPKEMRGVLPRYQIKNPDLVETLFEQAEEIDRLLGEPARSSWRWRILYVRAAGDRFLLQNDFLPCEATDALYHELETIYHAEKAIYAVAPVTRDSILRLQTE